MAIPLLGGLMKSDVLALPREQQRPTSQHALCGRLDIVRQAPWGIGHTHITSELLHVHYVGLTGTHHHIQPVKVDTKDPAAPQGDLPEFRSDGKGFTHCVFVRPDRPDPLDTEKLSANTIDFAIRSVR